VQDILHGLAKSPEIVMPDPGSSLGHHHASSSTGPVISGCIFLFTAFCARSQVNDTGPYFIPKDGALWYKVAKSE